VIADRAQSEAENRAEFCECSGTFGGAWPFSHSGGLETGESAPVMDITLKDRVVPESPNFFMVAWPASPMTGCPERNCAN
jgi:hypothetical protein